MMKILINESKALIYAVTAVRPHPAYDLVQNAAQSYSALGLTENEARSQEIDHIIQRAVNENTCFFNALHHLLPNSQEVQEITASVREALGKRLKQILELARWGKIIADYMTELESSDSPPESTTIFKKYNEPETHEKLKTALKVNIKANEPNAEYLSYIDNYVDHLLAYYGAVNPHESLALSEWIKRLENFTPFYETMLFDSLTKDEPEICATDERAGMRMMLFQQKKAAALGFQLQGTRPDSKNPAAFLSFLRTTGILMVGGFFHNDNFSADSRLPKQIGAMSVIARRKNSFKLSEPDYILLAHIVVVIGMSLAEFGEQQQDLIYYVDPSEALNESGEHDIHVVSYPNFCDRLGPYSGIIRLNENKLEETDIFMLSHPALAPTKMSEAKQDLASAPAKTSANTQGFWQQHCSKPIIATTAVAAAVSAFVIANTFS